MKSMTCLHSNEQQKSFHPARFGISGGLGHLAPAAQGQLFCISAATDTREGCDTQLMPSAQCNNFSEAEGIFSHCQAPQGLALTGWASQYHHLAWPEQHICSALLL